jgi:molybdopterin/thiamine biosynthesis adenylyltransferase
MQTDKEPLRVYVGVEEPQIHAGVYVGIDRDGAYVITNFQQSDFDSGNVWDAAIASCICAGGITNHLVFDQPIGARCAPAALMLSKLRVIDIRRIRDLKMLMLGFGAVGSNFLYWSHLLGLDLAPEIIDGDKVEPGNVSRGLIFFPHHCVKGKEWDKVGVARSIVAQAKTTAKFFDENLTIADRYDLVLCLANERDVRRRVADLRADVLMQATTSPDWSAQYHRHIRGIDDCVNCRTGDIRQKSPFLCSSGEIATSGGESDAAMPFLSALSALILLLEVVHFETGEEGLKNAVTFAFRDLHRPVRHSQFKPKPSCPICGTRVLTP